MTVKPVKRVKVSDGVFTGGQLVFDTTQPWDEKTVTLFRKMLTATDEPHRVERLKAFIASHLACGPPEAPVALRLRQMVNILEGAKRARARECLALIRNAELIQREIMTLPLLRKVARFSQGNPKRSEGPMKRLIRKVIRRGGVDVTARALWDACKALPERQRSGIEFYETYARIDGHPDCGRPRFANLVSEVKKSLR